MARPRDTFRLRGGWTMALRRLAARRSVILGYHGVAAVPRAEDLFLLQLEPNRFRAQLEMMLEAGFRFLTVAELADLAAGSEPPPGVAVVSFDDALQNNLTVAAPILSDLGIRPTVYVPSGWLGGRSPWIGERGGNRILTAEELCRLAEAGWEVGAHTRTHADLSTLGYEDCLAEIEGSADDLEQLTGTRPRTLAYPYGRYGPEAVAAARAAGLSAAVTTGSGSWEPFELTRAMVGAADPLPVLALKLTDRYEPLLSAPPLRAARMASKQLRNRLGARRGGG